MRLGETIGSSVVEFNVGTLASGLRRWHFWLPNQWPRAAGRSGVISTRWTPADRCTLPNRGPATQCHDGLGFDLYDRGADLVVVDTDDPVHRRDLRCASHVDGPRVGSHRPLSGIVGSRVCPAPCKSREYGRLITQVVKPAPTPDYKKGRVPVGRNLVTNIRNFVSPTERSRPVAGRWGDVSSTGRSTTVASSGAGDALGGRQRAPTR